MSYQWKLSLLWLVTTLAGCTTGTTLPVAEIEEASLKDHALLFGSILQPPGSWDIPNKLYATSEDGTPSLAIAGDRATAVRTADGAGEVLLFTQLVEPGTYEFSLLASPRMKSLVDETETFEAGQIVYLGQQVCLNVWYSCVWISIDQLGRDLYYANQTRPDLPWHRTGFRIADAMSSGLDFRFRQVNLQPPGAAVHRKSGVTFPTENTGFQREHVITHGMISGGANYHHPDLDADVQVLVYPVNLFEDAVAELGLSDRLRNVVLNRESSLALTAYFSERPDLKEANFAIDSDIAVLVRNGVMHSGWRLDATAPDITSERVRFYIFSVGGWVIRYRMTWHEGTQKSENDERQRVYEDAFARFLAAQSWPVQEGEKP